MGRIARIAALVLLAAVVVYVLFTVVFPMVDGWIDDPAVEPPQAASAPIPVPTS